TSAGQVFLAREDAADVEEHAPLGAHGGKALGSANALDRGVDAVTRALHPARLTRADGQGLGPADSHAPATALFTERENGERADVVRDLVAEVGLGRDIGDADHLPRREGVHPRAEESGRIPLSIGVGGQRAVERVFRVTHLLPNEAALVRNGSAGLAGWARHAGFSGGAVLRVAARPDRRARSTPALTQQTRTARDADLERVGGRNLGQLFLQDLEPIPL